MDVFLPSQFVFSFNSPVFYVRGEMSAQINYLQKILPFLTVVFIFCLNFATFGQKMEKSDSETVQIFAPQDLYGKSDTSIKTELDSVASISGHISDAYGRGIRGALLVVFDTHGSPPMITMSNMFGFFRFDGLATGEEYIITVLHGKYLFFNNSRSFTLNGAMTGMNFQAEEP